MVDKMILEWVGPRLDRGEDVRIDEVMVKFKGVKDLDSSEVWRSIKRLTGYWGSYGEHRLWK